MGKSTSGSSLSARGIPVVDTDGLAREESRVGSEAFLEIVEAFGTEILSFDGAIDRKRLADRVFFDATARQRLESILHPRIARRWRDEVRRYEKEGESKAVVLIPLLFERQYESEFTYVLTIACTPATQRRRLLDRGWSQTQIDARNAAQLPVSVKMERARFVVWTEGGLSSHEAQLDRILQTLPAT